MKNTTTPIIFLLLLSLLIWTYHVKSNLEEQIVEVQKQSIHQAGNYQSCSNREREGVISTYLLIDGTLLWCY